MKPLMLTTFAASFIGLQFCAADTVFESEHTFALKDVLGDFEGTTFLDDRSIICSSFSTCPGEAEPFQSKDGTWLFPIDSEFGFNVVDFFGAVERTRDYDYQEGFAGNILDGNTVVGLALANAETSTYKVPPPLGTWCQGLASTSVKCSTEHYSVMEHVLTCHETIPYFFADPIDGTQATPGFPGEEPSFDCEDAQLDDTLVLVDSGELFDGSNMEPNDNTRINSDLAAGLDYSVTLKDDGKVLYRWGSLIKRPTDIRVYAKMELPEEWKDPDANFHVVKAHLEIEHLITNNPNDQIRPEDMENEAATGRKPDYRVEKLSTPNNPDEVDAWLTIDSCYEGDGDAIGFDDEAATEIPEGTVLKSAFRGEYLSAGGDGDYPGLFSSDLREGFTNAYYTTINRDPFEWSYRMDTGDDSIYKFEGSLEPLNESEDDRLVSGPRWRLRANKFGQDVPGLEIPLVECSEPPFQSDNIKYEVGARAKTVINLLDWADSNSPLARSKGWVDYNSNVAVRDITREIDGKFVTTNGLPMTDDFDLAIYIKGDRKPTELYNAKLVVTYNK